jgi:hypothetical protein
MTSDVLVSYQKSRSHRNQTSAHATATLTMYRAAAPFVICPQLGHF